MFNQGSKNEEKTWCSTTTIVEAQADHVFWVLTAAPMLWWVLPFPQEWNPDRMLMEARVGGKLLGLWNDRSEDEGILIGTVTALRKPELLTMLFSFPLSGATATFSLEAQGMSTEVTVMFHGERTSPEAWLLIEITCKEFLKRLKTFTEVSMAPVSYDQSSATAAEPVDSDDPELALEQLYMDLQNTLIQVRQGAAQAIAAEKQLEQQLQKNKDQADTWQSRASMSREKGDEDLMNQALARGNQYAQAAKELDEQLKSQREATDAIRQKLTQLEGQVQMAYTKKQVLIARHRASQAMLKANEILSRSSTSEAMSVIERMERRVAEREAEALAMEELKGKPSEDGAGSA